MPFYLFIWITKVLKIISNKAQHSIVCLFVINMLLKVTWFISIFLIFAMYSPDYCTINQN